MIEGKTLFIGVDSLGLLDKIQPQEILVWSKKTEKRINNIFPEIKTKRFYGIATNYTNNVFETIVVFEAGLNILPALKNNVIKEADRIGRKVFLIRETSFHPLCFFDNNRKSTQNTYNTIEI